MAGDASGPSSSVGGHDVMFANRGTLNRLGPAALVGVCAAFVAALGIIRAIRPALLLDPEPSWLLARFLLWLALLSGAASAGGLAAGLFLLWSRSRWSPDLQPSLSFSRPAIFVLAAGALCAGTVLRFVALDRIPSPLWIDDVSLIAPALALHGDLTDFSNTVRAAPFGVSRPYGSVGVLYLELFRLALRNFGTTVLGVRFLSAAAGVLSIATAMLLGRALLPRGGGALAALVLAGLRWSLLLSRWAWNAIVLAPLADIAALLLLRARRGNLLWAVAAGLVAGLATHIYLAAWIVAAALLLFAAWPDERATSARPRFQLPLVFALAFGVAAAPLFVLNEGRVSPYFARASDHSLVREIRYTHSPLPAFAALADSLTAPWLGVDPFAHHDLAGKTRLGWILGIAVAVAFGRSLLRPREPSSAFLLAHAGAGLAGSVAGGHAGLPNSYRFAYLSTVTAVAAAGGILSIVGCFPNPRRRAAALAAIGLLAISGALASRDAILRWPDRRETFDGFHGSDTLIARAMVRWQRFGPVTAVSGIPYSPITVEAIRRYRLDPDQPIESARTASSRAASFRLAPPGAPPAAGERLVEKVGDAWGREWGRIYGVRRPRPPL
jgi:hypothetical protein